MRHHLVLLFLGAGLVAGLGCGDDTTTGGGGSGGNDGGNGPGGNNPDGGGGGVSNGGENPGGGGFGPGGMGPGYSCDEPTGEVPALTLTELTTVDRPVQIKSAPGDPERLYILEQHLGRIRIYEDGALVDTPFLDVGALIRTNNEEGLLGLAFHPDFADNGRFFIHYSATDGTSTVMEYHTTPGALEADDTEPKVVLQHPTAEANHNGGAVEFGNDGFLYISLGDGGDQCDHGCDAMNPGTFLGKILRVDVDADGYPAAAGNPGGDKFFHIGFRNPWRITFDACTGDLYIGDVGQNAFEEIDVATRAAGAINFGWPIREGAHNQDLVNTGCPGDVGYDGSCDDMGATLVEPIAEFSHGEGCSVTGGYVYRGSEIPGLRGYYFYGDYCAGFIRIMRAVDGLATVQPITTDIQVDELSAFGQDGNGEVYVGGLGGIVYRVDPG